MATFHITLKHDRKSGGEKVKPTEHVKYINREGRYADADEKESKKNFENYIRAASQKNLYSGKFAKLYASLYGNIDNTPKGLQVTGNPSIETLAIALMVAKEGTGDKEIILSGSARFRERCVHAAVAADLDIHFTDTKLEQLFEKEKGEKEDERRRREVSGQRVRTRAGLCKPHPDPAGPAALAPSAERHVPGLPELSQRYMAANRQEDPAVLLQGDEHDLLVESRADSAPPLRWDLSWGRRRIATETAQKILKNVERSLDQVFAASHVEYINREKAFAQRGGCIYKEQHLPKWAKGNPSTFWQAADRYSEKNARRYMEVEFALPNELTLDQQKELIHTFLDTHLRDHYYNLAIHDKVGVMSDGLHNRHVHITFSPKLIDDVEKKKERKRSDYFKRAIHQDNRDQSEENRRQHGAPVDRKWEEKEFLLELRASFADIVNGKLEKYGHLERVDHRSLAAQREEAKANGDTFLAALLDRIPEQHIAQSKFLEERNPEVEELRRYRKLKQDQLDLLFAADMMRKDIQASRIQMNTEKLKKQIEAVTQSREYQEGELDPATIIGELKQNFLQAVTEFQKWDRRVMKKDEIITRVKLEYMDEDERENYQMYRQKLEERQHWRIFQKNLKPPQEGGKDAQDAYEKLVPALEKKIDVLTGEIQELQPKINAINKRLNGRDYKGKIERCISGLMFSNQKFQNELEKAQRELDTATRALSSVLFGNAITEDGQQSYTAKELYAIARRRYYGLLKEVKKLQKAVKQARKSVISPERARVMAEDRIMKGACRKLRKEQRDLRKKQDAWQKDWQELQKDIQSLGGAMLTAELAQKKAELEAGRDTLETMQSALQKEADRIDSVLWENQLKLEDITLGILRKNAPQAKELERLEARLKDTQERLEEAKVQMNGMREQVKKDEPKTRYRIAGPSERKGNAAPPPPSPQYPRTSVIMQAILGDANMTQLVMRSKPERDDLDKWEFLSDLHKDEILSGEMMRDI